MYFHSQKKFKIETLFFKYALRDEPRTSYIHIFIIFISSLFISSYLHYLYLHIFIIYIFIHIFIIYIFISFRASLIADTSGCFDCYKIDRRVKVSQIDPIVRKPQKGHHTSGLQRTLIWPWPSRIFIYLFFCTSKYEQNAAFSWQVIYKIYLQTGGINEMSYSTDRKSTRLNSSHL